MTTPLTIYRFGLCGNSANESIGKHRFWTKKHQKVNKSSQNTAPNRFGYWRPRVRVPPLRPKRVDSPCGCLLFCWSGEGKNSPLRSRMRVRILREERVVKRRESIRKQLSVVFPRAWPSRNENKLACKRQAWEYSPPVKIPPSIIFHRTQNRTKVLRRLENIVCYSAVRMRRMTQYTASGMRLRKLLCPTTFIFLGHVSKNSY